MSCYICLYVPLAKDLDDDARAETETVVIVFGMSVCVRHAPFATDRTNEALNWAAEFESDGEVSTLSEWQALQGGDA